MNSVSTVTKVSLAIRVQNASSASVVVMNCGEEKSGCFERGMAPLYTHAPIQARAAAHTNLDLNEAPGLVFPPRSTPGKTDHARLSHPYLRRALRRRRRLSRPAF